VSAVSPRTVVITGANAGLGFETSLALARTGAHVIMACRSKERAEQAQRDLLEAVPAAATTIVPLDVSEPESIRTFARELEERGERLDVLINNAGIVAVPLARNSVGHEMQLATNYLGAFALTGLLLPRFREGSEGRVVNVGSHANRLGKLPLDDLDWERTPYREFQAYARSKLALLSFTLELERRLRRSGSDVIAVGAHPGIAATEIRRHSPMLTATSFVGRCFEKLGEWVTPPASEACRSIVHAACDEGVRGGEYWGPRGLLEIGSVPAPARVNPVARDVELGRRLWSLSEAMTGVRYLSDL
jgi:NAD(P)-dependent dehydrogenase (short-subunit alcohol dehydrogenase family)